MKKPRPVRNCAFFVLYALIITLFNVSVILFLWSNAALISQTDEPSLIIAPESDQKNENISKDSKQTTWNITCEAPSLPRHSVHVVIGGYKEEEKGAAFGIESYLFDLGLTNADIFWYRRINELEPLSPSINGPCGIRMHERLLLPNLGRDAAAFLDHVLEVYQNPPKMLIYLHGHAAIGWHTSCAAVFGRTAYYYRQLVSRKSAILNHTMTLTSNKEGTLRVDPFGYFGSANGKRVPLEEVYNKTIPVSATEKSKLPVARKFISRWSHLLNKSRPAGSCCASFIIPGERLRRYPPEFYADLKAVNSAKGDGAIGRDAWEYIVYPFFGDDVGQFTFEQVVDFYDNADGLVYGKERTPKVRNPDNTVVKRMERCLVLTDQASRKFNSRVEQTQQ